MTDIIRIGTRGSKLALTQTDMVARLLTAAYPGLRVETVVINTSGDWRPEHGETRLSPDGGGKALFAREIEMALLDGAVDCGVHSLKDMPAILPPGLVIEHVLPREDMRDAFLSDRADTLAALPAGAVVGTSSLRRQAFVLAQRPDLRVVTLRGNVPTRIEKMRAGQVDAAILAAAGLRRLGLIEEARSLFSVDEMLPAGCQGIVGIEIREGDDRMRALLAAIHDAEVGLCAVAERAALAALGGSCHTPVGALAERNGARMRLRLKLADPDGSAVYAQDDMADVNGIDDARALGARLGAALRAIAPAALLDAV